MSKRRSRFAEFPSDLYRFAKSERGRDEICLLLIFALVSVMLRRCLYGDPPIGHDHPAHLVRIWQLGHTLLHHPLAPWTWSHLWFAGYPQNAIYPIGADLCVLALRLLSLGTLSLTCSYALAFFLFYFGYGAAVYLFVSRAVQSRIAALLAVLFLLTDPGSNDQGGWFWIVDLGVWTAALGVGPVLIALLQINSLFDKIDNRRVVFAILCIGFAFLCHPLHLIFVALAVPILCLCRYFNGELTQWHRSLIVIAFIVAVATLIACYWLVPYFASLPYAAPIGRKGESVSKIGRTLASATFFERMNPFAATFGLIGAVALLTARRTLALFMSIFIFVAVALACSTFKIFLGTSASEWIGKHILVTRFLMLAKPFWYGAAGFGLVAVARGMRSLGRIDRHNPFDLRWGLRLAAIALLVGPIAFYFLTGFTRSEIRRPSVWLSERKDRLARKDFVEWMTTIDRQDSFFRIAHGFRPNQHDLADLALVLPRPFYEAGPTPTGHFKYDVHASTNAAFRATNIRFALSPTLMSSRPDLIPRVSFHDKLFVYEFRDWNPLPFEIDGSGTVDLVLFHDDEIILRAGAGAQGTLRLNVTNYPKWRATIDGAPVLISGVAVPDVSHSEFMQIPLRPGTIRFRFELGAVDYLGTLFTLIGLALCIVVLKRPGFVRRWEMSI